jgi:hypothetical protein
MFTYSNPDFQLNLAHQRAAELRRQAAAHRLGRSAGRHARSGRRSGNSSAGAVRAPAVG